MDLVLEDFTPYDRSSLWRIHDSYFAQKGAAAWTEGAIPHAATSNYGIARQHARFLAALAAEVAPEGEVPVLEVGCGLGAFAERLFEALAHGAGAAGRALLPRLRYVLTDYAERTVREAAARPGLARLVAEGAVVPATLDIRAPGAPTALDGQPVGGPFVAIFASYVCCVSPAKIVARTPGGFVEAYARLVRAIPDGMAIPEGADRALLAELLRDPTRPDLLDTLRIDFDLRPVDLAAALGPLHAGAIGDVTAPFPEATLTYPRAFFDFLAAMGALARPGGAAIVADYGSPRPESLRGLIDRRPRHYGNTLNHDVSFAVVEAWCRRAGLGIARTADDLRMLQIAAIRYGEDFPASLRRAFRRAYVEGREGQDLVDFRAAARCFEEKGDPAGAARMAERALRLDPRSFDLLREAAEACYRAGRDRRALRHLRRALRLHRERADDLAAPFGLVNARLERFERAARWLERATARNEDQALLAELAAAYERLGDRGRAYLAYRRALERDRESDVAKEIMKRLIDDYLAPWIERGL